MRPCRLIKHNGRMELAFIRGLGHAGCQQARTAVLRREREARSSASRNPRARNKHDSFILSSVRQAVVELLSDGLVDQLASTLWCALQELSRAEAVTSSELHDKFLADSGSFTLSFGGLSTFYSGLAGRGPPPTPTGSPHPPDANQIPEPDPAPGPHSV